MAQNDESYSRSESADSAEDAEVERIYRERQLQRQAQQELASEKLKDQALTKEELGAVIDQAEKIQSKLDDAAIVQKDLKKLVSTLDSLFAANQDKRDQYRNEPLKYMESEEQLAEHLHELQGLTAYPDRIEYCILEGLIESVLATLVHPNLDICKLSVTLLYELCDSELAESHNETVVKVV